MTETLNTELPDTLPVECVCVPDSPFYLRWLNRFGGIDFWMFEKRQTLGRKLDDSETYRPVIFDYSQATGTDYSANLVGSERVTVGAELLNVNEWYELSRIAFSPMVQWYDERTGVWIDVLVEKGDNDMITDTHAQVIEYDILLPVPQIQL